MLIAAAFALLLSPQQQTIVKDSTKADMSAVGRRHAPLQKPVTPELRASAFHDTVARDLFDRARAARVRQDSTLVAYDAKVVQRLTVKAAIGKVPLEKLMYRQDNSARVRWDKKGGAHVEVTGARVAVPPVGMPDVERDAIKDQLRDPELIPIPYFPGYEPLWAGSEKANPQVNEHDIINPLAEGAEAYYTYRARDAVSLHLADGRTITVQQVDVRPRVASFNGVVGSLWIDRASGQLVRAAYRLAMPAEATFGAFDSSGKRDWTAQIIMGVLTPKMSGDVTSVVVEYELYDGFWLPRLQSAEGFIALSFARVPITFDNRFSYESVNRVSGLPAIQVDTTETKPSKDSTRSDSAKATGVSAAKDQCDTASTRVVTRYRRDLGIPVQMSSTCNIEELAHSPDLPKSIYDPGDEIFDLGDARRLIDEALALSDQAPLSLTNLPRPALRYGASMTRYNRVEGWSTGFGIDQQLGAGMDVSAAIRAGTSDHAPRWEASAGRSNSAQSVHIGGYDRLVSVSEREDPLKLGASLLGFFFGRDDALYYQAKGGELRWRIEQAPRFELRLFAESQTSAPSNVSSPLSGSFVPDLNSHAGSYRGASIEWTASHGIDPRGLRLSSVLRVEGAQADSFYGRASLDLLATRPLFLGLDGSLSAAGGNSVGFVPAQRLWYLGGTGTVRGERPDPALGGNAFWLGRAELGPTAYVVKPTLFADVGWAGDRSHLDRFGRPTSGVGVGLSFLDGAIRLDLARGLYPVQRTQLSFYLGSIF
jgi:hypothetical protein